MELRGVRAERVRPSAAERERIVGRLRAGHLADRLSLQTFVDRLDVAYAARSRRELAEVVADLPDTGPVARAVVAAAEALARWTALFGSAWHHARLPGIALPESRSTVIGRSRACDCVVANPTVSRMHALLRPGLRDGCWSLSDLDSTNGTWLNGRRVLADVEVRPGDELALGDATFRVLRPARTMRRSARVLGPHHPSRA